MVCDEVIHGAAQSHIGFMHWFLCIFVFVSPRAQSRDFAPSPFASCRLMYIICDPERAAYVIRMIIKIVNINRETLQGSIGAVNLILVMLM